MKKLKALWRTFLIFSAIVGAFVAGCKEKKEYITRVKEEIVKAHEVNKPSPPKVIHEAAKRDTAIKQEISYNDGNRRYILQTWIVADWQRVPECFKYENQFIKTQLLDMDKSYGYYVAASGHTLKEAPYCSEISGTFNYIKNNKIKEYDKAFFTLNEFIKKDKKATAKERQKAMRLKAAQDSVTLLQNHYEGSKLFISKILDTIVHHTNPH